MTPRERHDMPMIVAFAALVAAAMLIYWGVVLWKD